MKHNLLAHPPARPIEDEAILAIRAGRHLVDLWKDCPVHFTREIERRISATLGRLINGEVCRMADDPTLEIMFDAICEALDDISPGYGDLMRSQSTDDCKRDVAALCGEA